MFKENLSILFLKEAELTTAEKKNIHFNSLKNFMMFYDAIKGSKEKEIVKNLISQYWLILLENDFNISKEDSKGIGRTFIMKIGQYYNHQLGFQITMGLNGSIFIGIILDLILLISGISPKIYFIPIGTLTLIFLNLVKSLVLGRRNKLYGPHY